MKILLTGAVQWTEGQINEIRDLGHEVIYIQDERISLNDLNIAEDCIEAVICNGLFLYNDIEKFKKLKYIQLTSAGFDRVPMQYINENQIIIHNARGVYSIPMAEYALSGVMQLYKQSRFFYENQKKHRWEKHRSVLELSGKKVCIVGCGNVGTECAKRFAAFGCDVIGVDLYPRMDENYKEIVNLESLNNVLQESDIVVLTVPLTKETHYLMNAERLDIMKRGAILVNIARGGILDTRALSKGLEKLGGAVLDVFEEEPLNEDNPIWEMEKVIITPHNSFVGEGNRERLQSVFLDNLRKLDETKN